MIDDNELVNFQKNSFCYDLSIVRNSPTLTILETQNEIDMNIIKNMLQYPILSSTDWMLSGGREFHMTDDADKFHTSNVGPPLFEGKMIEQFREDLTPPRYWIDNSEGRNALLKKELHKLKKFKNEQISPRIALEEYRLVWRIISNPTNTRTLISTILPPNVFLGASLNYIHPIYFDGANYDYKISHQEMIYLCGMFNSFILDYYLRKKVGTNMTVFQIMELPIPRFDKNNSLHQKIFKNSSMLICSTDKYAELRDKVGVTDFTTDPTRRFGLMAQINAFSAKIYGLSNNELEHVLKAFPSTSLKKLKESTLDEFSLLQN